MNMFDEELEEAMKEGVQIEYRRLEIIAIAAQVAEAGHCRTGSDLADRVALEWFANHGEYLGIDEISDAIWG